MQEQSGKDLILQILKILRQTEGVHKIWTSIALGGFGMLAKETGVTVFLLNLAYDTYKSWPFIKRSILEVKLTKETHLFASRAAKVLTSVSEEKKKKRNRNNQSSTSAHLRDVFQLGFLLAVRLALLQGSLPRFSQQDNPTAFHSSIYVRYVILFIT